MKPRRLLLISYFFPPCAASASYRMLGLARHLPAFNWQVSVVTASNVPHEPHDAELASRVPPQTRVFAPPFPQNWLMRQLRRYIGYHVWLPRAYKACVRAIDFERPDAVLTSSPPHCVHFLGLLLKKRFRLPWVAEFRDPWIANNSNLQHRTVQSVWESYCEAAVIKQADRIVLNTPSARTELQRAFPAQASKMIVITNGYDPEVFAALR